MNSDDEKMIGVVGGVGPYAGIDLVRKIFDQTNATLDQQHLPLSLLSVPHKILDRTEFLVGKVDVNPGIAIAEVICALHKQGASVVGIPCNTAHAAPIFEEIVIGIPHEVRLLHMIDEAARYIKECYPAVVNVGILSTTGTFLSNVYPDSLFQHGLKGIQVLKEMQERIIHPAIYNLDYGIKAKSNPVTAQAKKNLQSGIEYLMGQGADAIILGCTEIPLALTGDDYKGLPLIDPTETLARALILETSPDALLK